MFLYTENTRKPYRTGKVSFFVAMVKYFFTTLNFILTLQSNYYLCPYERFKNRNQFRVNVTYPFVFCFRQGQEKKIEFMTLKEKVKRNFVKWPGRIITYFMTFLLPARKKYDHDSHNK